CYGPTSVKPRATRNASKQSSQTHYDLQPIDKGLWNATDSLVIPFGDQCRVTTLLMQDDSNVSTVKHVRAVETCKLRPTSIAMVLIPVIGRRFVIGEPKCCSP